MYNHLSRLYSRTWTNGKKTLPFVRVLHRYLEPHGGNGQMGKCVNHLSTACKFEFTICQHPFSWIFPPDREPFDSPPKGTEFSRKACRENQGSAKFSSFSKFGLSSRRSNSKQSPILSKFS